MPKPKTTPLDELIAMAPVKDTSDLCVICTSKIEVMCFKGTGVCSELCNKSLKGE